MKRALTDLLNWLNGIGTMLLAYALLNPDAANEFLAVLPSKFRTPTALMIPAAWWLVVQYGKARAIKKSSGNA